MSKIYAGTGAIGSIGAGAGSKIIDGARSAARTIQNNLLDSSKQEAIDILLVGSTLSSELADRARILLPTNMLHAPTPVLREMCKRYSEYVTPSQLRVSVGTYNVNGGKHFRSVVYKDLSLIDWLSPKSGKTIDNLPTFYVLSNNFLQIRLLKLSILILIMIRWQTFMLSAFKKLLILMQATSWQPVVTTPKLVSYSMIIWEFNDSMKSLF